MKLDEYIVPGSTYECEWYTLVVTSAHKDKVYFQFAKRSLVDISWESCEMEYEVFLDFIRESYKFVGISGF